MKRLLSAAILVACGAPLFGQLGSDSVTVTASRSIALQPDQIVFAVYVRTTSEVALDDIVAVLQGTGITAANLTAATAIQPSFRLGSRVNPLTTQWGFSFAAPLSKIKETIAALKGAQQKAGSGIVIEFLAQGAQISPQLQQAQSCSRADLISDAQAAARKLTDAAGLHLGPVLAVSDSAPAPSGIAVANRWFSVSGFLLGYAAPPFGNTTCSAVVKFQLVRY